MAYTETNGPRILRKKRKWLTASIVLSIVTIIINVFFTLFNLYLINQNLEINRENQQFQSMMSNFTSVMTIDANYAMLGAPSEYWLEDNVTIRTVHYGHLNVTFQVITPHYGKVAIRLKKFELFSSSEFLDPQLGNQTRIDFDAFSNHKYEYTVIPGLNSFGASLHLRVEVFPDPKKIPPEANSVSLPIGFLTCEAEFTDIQTNTTAPPKEFGALVIVVLHDAP